MQTRLNTGPPGFSLRPGPASAPLQGQVRGTGGAKARPGARGSPRTSSLLARSCLRKGPTACWQIAPSPTRPFHALNFIATALAPPWRSPSSRRETRKGKPLERPPAFPPPPIFFPRPRPRLGGPLALFGAGRLPSSLLPTPPNQESSRKPWARRSSGHLLFFDGLKLGLNERMCLRDWSQNRSGLSILGYCRNPYFFRRKTL